MAKKVYLSRIFFDAIALGGIGAWRHKLQTYGGQVYGGGEILTGANGLPSQKALLVVCDSTREQELSVDSDLISFPAVPLNTTLASIPLAQRNALKAKIKAHGFTDAQISTLVDGAVTVRDVINNFGKLNNPHFNVDTELA